MLSSLQLVGLRWSRHVLSPPRPPHPPSSLFLPSGLPPCCMIACAGLSLCRLCMCGVVVLPPHRLCFSIHSAFCAEPFSLLPRAQRPGTGGAAASLTALVNASAPPPNATYRHLVVARQCRMQVVVHDSAYSSPIGLRPPLQAPPWILRTGKLGKGGRRREAEKGCAGVGSVVLTV